MAEENTEQKSEDADELEATDTPDVENESEVENGQSPEAADAAGAAEDVQPEPVESDVPEPANEPAVGNEISVEEPTRVSAADGGELTTPITDISMLLDIPVTLSMEIGQTRISINELLKLGKGSVIELQRMAHEPLDVLVNGTLVAHGEAVVVGDRFGIRLTDVISPQERLRKFG